MDGTLEKRERKLVLVYEERDLTDFWVRGIGSAVFFRWSSPPSCIQMSKPEESKVAFSDLLSCILSDKQFWFI
jgi:hypothetical protein